MLAPHCRSAFGRLPTIPSHGPNVWSAGARKSTFGSDCPELRLLDTEGRHSENGFELRIGKEMAEELAFTAAQIEDALS